jgi:hypothetical protein
MEIIRHPVELNLYQMIINQTGASIFDDFKRKYIDDIYAMYPHIAHMEIYCLDTEQYANLDGVPAFDRLDDTPFAYSCNRDDVNKVIGYVIYSPNICSFFEFNSSEFEAAIAHEIGHIIHYFNESLKDLPQICQEIKADEVADKLGLKDALISILSKFIQSNKFPDCQKHDMEKRLLYLNC